MPTRLHTGIDEVFFKAFRELVEYSKEHPEKFPKGPPYLILKGLKIYKSPTLSEVESPSLRPLIAGLSCGCAHLDAYARI